MLYRETKDKKEIVPKLADEGCEGEKGERKSKAGLGFFSLGAPSPGAANLAGCINQGSPLPLKIKHN